MKLTTRQKDIIAPLVRYELDFQDQQASDPELDKDTRETLNGYVKELNELLDKLLK